MPLTEESKERLNKALELMKGETHHKISQIAHMTLGIALFSLDIADTKDEDALRELIEKNMTRPCPECENDFEKQLTCNLCHAKGEITGFKEREYLRKKGQPVLTQ